MLDTAIPVYDTSDEVPLNFATVRAAVRHDHQRRPFLLLDLDLVRRKLRRRNLENWRIGNEIRSERRGAPVPCTDLAAGDCVYVPNAGAYTTAYGAWFNGFPPPNTVVLQRLEAVA